MSLFARFGLSPAVFCPEWQDIQNLIINRSFALEYHRPEVESKESESGNRKINPQVDTSKSRL